MTGSPAGRGGARAPGREQGARLRRFVLLASLAASVVAPAGASAALRRATASVDPPVVLQGESVTVTVTAESDGFTGAVITPPTVPGLDIERVGTSQNVVMGAGNVMRSDVAIFRVTASAVGKQTIPGFRVELGRERTETGPVHFETVASLPQGGSAPRAADGAEGSSPLFARLLVDRRHVYWNEQIVARVQIYSRRPLEDMPTWEPPDAAGFWIEPLGDPTHDRAMVDGRPYERYERVLAFFPTRTGRLTLGPARGRVRVLQAILPAFDPMGGFFPSPPAEVVELPIEAAPVDIEVDPLPGGAPSGFHGAVGRFTLGVRVDRPRVKAGEPITVSTSVRGDGNLASAADPTVTARPATASYPAGARTELDRRGDRVRGVRRRDVAFIPDHPGSLLVLPIEFAWFDPEEGRYRVQRSDTIAVRVDPAPGGVALGSDVAQTAVGIPAPPRAANAKGARGDLTGWPTPLPLGAGVVSFAAYLAFAFAAASRRRLAKDPAWRRERMAAEAALRVATAAGDANPLRAAEATEAALRDAAGIRFGIDPEGRSRRDLLERLRGAGVEAAAIEELMGVLERLERATFAPGGSADIADALRAAAALADRWRDACRR